MFAFETVFISEQIAENKCGALSEKSMTKLNVFSYMMKHLEIGKDMKIKHMKCPLSLKKKYGGTFFLNKLCMEEQTFLGKFMRGYFTSGLMIRSCKRRGKVSQMHFPVI